MHRILLITNPVQGEHLIAGIRGILEGQG